MSRALLGLILLASGCADQLLVVRPDVPVPGASQPYGWLVVQVDPGDTRHAQLVLKGAAMFTRAADVPASGLLVVRLPEGRWDVQVTGNAGEGEVVKFSGAGDGPKPSSRAPMWWPKEPLEVRVRDNRLTNAGRMCAHTGCERVWSAYDPPGVDAWAEADRLILYEGPTEEAEQK